MAQAVLAVLSVMLAALFAGCSSTPAPDSGIEGTAMMGPTCPVQQNPPDPNCADKPYVGKLVVSDHGGVAIQEFTTGQDGTFRVAVPPGGYHITGPTAQSLPSCSSDAFVVVAGAYTPIDVSCDTGIR